MSAPGPYTQFRYEAAWSVTHFRTLTLFPLALLEVGESAFAPLAPPFPLLSFPSFVQEKPTDPSDKITDTSSF